MLAQLDGTADRRDQPHQAFHQRCLTQSVRAGNHHFLTLFQHPVDRFGQWFIIADHQIACGKDNLARGFPHLEAEGRLRLFRAQFNPFHLCQLLRAGIRHAAGRDARFIAGDEILHPGNFLLLTLIRCFQRQLVLFVQAVEFIHVADIAGQPAVFHMVDEIDDLVGKRHIVRNEDKRVFIVLQISFQPADMLLIEIVGRFVQKQNVRFFQKQLR